jgi:signal transduction histidine kinase
MRIERIEETTEANRVAAASVARERALGASEQGRAEPRLAAWLPGLVRLLSAPGTAARSAVLAQASELLVRGLGADRVGIYLPAPAVGPEGAVASSGEVERFVLAASFAAPGSWARTIEGDALVLDALELSRDDEAGRKLLAGRPVRVFLPFPRRRFGAAPGAPSPAGWSRVHATLQIPCPGPDGRPVALIHLAGPSLAPHASRDFDRAIETAASLLAGFLERERLVRELAALRVERAHDQRLAALGRVASSAAHDLNNVLTVIVGHADLLELELPGAAEHVPDSPAGEALEEIRSAAARGARLVEEVLAYGRKRPAGHAPVDLALALGQLDGMLHRVAGDAIELAIGIEPGLPRVRLDLERFERILVNLVVNARHAIESGPGHPGRIELRLERVRADDRPDGPDRVRLRVRDNGCGMDEAVQRRVFEPFFTTRGAEGGTGLGLADVADFARDAGATIALASAPGAGCEIELRFPMVDPTARIAPQAPSPRPLSSVPSSAFPTAR